MTEIPAKDDKEQEKKTDLFLNNRFIGIQQVSTVFTLKRTVETFKKCEKLINTFCSPIKHLHACLCIRCPRLTNVFDFTLKLIMCLCIEK